MNFYQFCKQLDGEQPEPEPGFDSIKKTPEGFLDYIAMITNSSKVNGTEDGTWDLTPIE